MNKSDFRNLEEAYSKVNNNQRLIEENDTETKQKEAKSALLTVRLPWGVKEDLERIASERGVKMTPVVEGYFVAAKAMEKLKVVYPELHEKIMSAQSPDDIKVILEQLVRREIKLESTIEEGIISAAKKVLAHLFDAVKKLGKSIHEAIVTMSEILFVYVKKGQNPPEEMEEEEDEDDDWEDRMREARKSYVPSQYRGEDSRDEHDSSL